MKCKVCKKEFKKKIFNQKYCCIKCKRRYWVKHKSEKSKKNTKIYNAKWWRENKQKSKKYHLKYHNKILEYNRKRTKTEKFKIKLKRDYIKYHGHFLARAKANRHIKIPKGQICVRCKKKLAKYKHHEDYSKPLEVDFVCGVCHHFLDGKMRNAKVSQELSIY